MLQTVLQQARQAMASGDAIAAHRAYQQAHLLAPQDPQVRLDLAAACLACGTPDQALAHANAAAQRTAGWRLQLVLATAHQQLQQADEAAQHLGLALTDPSLPDAQRTNALQQQARVLLNAFGDASGAAQALQVAARVDPALVLEADLGRQQAEGSGDRLLVRGRPEVDAFARQAHPVFDVVDCKVDPHIVRAVDRGEQTRSVAEAALPGFKSRDWIGIFAPAATPPQVVARLNAEIVKAMQDPAIKSRLAQEGTETLASTPEEYGAYMRREMERWGKAMKSSGVVNPD